MASSCALFWKGRAKYGSMPSGGKASPAGQLPRPWPAGGRLWIKPCDAMGLRGMAKDNRHAKAHVCGSQHAGKSAP